MSKLVLDTNIILDNPEIINEKPDLAISYITLAELDGLKKNPDLSYSARTAIKNIFEKYADDLIQIIDIPTEDLTNDEKIVNSCKSIDGTLMSRDIGALVVAKTRGVPTVSIKETIDWDQSFKGYTEIVVSEEGYYSLTQNEYQPIEIDTISNLPTIPLNSYLVMYPSKDSTNYLCWRKTPDRYILVNQTTKPMRAAGIGIDYLHPEQLVAFDCVANTDTKLAVITGSVGSSKTLMSMCAALSRVAGHRNRKSYNKILVTRPNSPIHKQWELGFLKGDLNEKLAPWLAGFKSNLRFLYENTNKDRENEEAEKIYDEFFTGIAIESIQGASYHNVIFLVDEAQLLDTNTMKQILSRAAEGSKVVLILDQAQTYGANRGNEGWKRLLPHCKGNPLISFVELQHIQRGELTKLVSEMFD